MTTTDVPDQVILKDVAADDYSGLYAHLYADIAGQSPADAANDIKFANDQLVTAGALPGITIEGADTTGGDKNGKGLIVKDTGTGGAAETYTLNPTTGVARSEDGRIQAIFYQDGSVQRFNYEGNSQQPSEVIDADGKKHKVDPSKYEINQNTGVITIKTDKGTEEHRPDGSAVYKNATGQVTNVVYPYDKTDGNARSARGFTYDTNGNVTKVVEYNPDKPGDAGSQSTWTLQPDGTWKGVDGSGKQIGTSNAKFSVDGHGVTTTINPNGTVEQYYSNGWSMMNGPDGSMVSRDNTGKVVAVKQADGDWTGMVPGENGLPMANIDGKNYNQTANGWVGQGQDKPTYKDISYDQQTGHMTLVDMEGKKTVRKTDGSVLAYDKDGRLTSITDSSGNVVSSGMKYDANGQLTEFSQGGKTYKRDANDPTLWSDGTNPIKASISYDKEGNLVVAGAQETTWFYTNGLRAVQNNATKQTVLYDRNNQPIQQKKP